jgi:hypothetical protein
MQKYGLDKKRFRQNSAPSEQITPRRHRPAIDQTIQLDHDA